MKVNIKYDRHAKDHTGKAKAIQFRDLFSLSLRATAMSRWSVDMKSDNKLVFVWRSTLYTEVKIVKYFVNGLLQIGVNCK